MKRKPNALPPLSFTWDRIGKESVFWRTDLRLFGGLRSDRGQRSTAPVELRLGAFECLRLHVGLETAAHILQYGRQTPR